MKKIDLKKINFKDKKFIFPLILAVPVLFMGYMIYGIVGDLSSDTEEGNSPKEEIANVPMADSLSIASKFDAINDAYQNQQDFTAMQVEQEATRINADTTIYTAAEQAMLAQLEEEHKRANESITSTNARIQEANSQLAESRRSIGEESYRGGRGKDEDALNKEIMMYQKILRGEEILTPEEEEERKIAKVRQEEREKVLQEVNRQSTAIVEKVTTGSSSTAFNTIGKEQERNGYIRAMVDQGVTVTAGSRIRFRLLDEVKIQGERVPAGSQIYAIVTAFGEQRVQAQVTSIITKGKRVKVNLSVYDRDGIEGFFIPKSSFRDFSRQAGAQALGQSNVNITNNSESVEGVAIQALQGVYQSATSAISRKIQENKAKIKYNTIIYLINDNE